MVRKSQQKAVAKYTKEHYDSITVRASKGTKERIRYYAERLGVSSNRFITDAIVDALQKQSGRSMSVARVGSDTEAYHVMYRDETVADVFLSDDHKHISYFLYAKPGPKQPFSGGPMTLSRFYAYLKSRCYEDCRGDLEETLAFVGMKSNDPWEWVRNTHGVMYSDEFWIRFDSENIRWKDVNPYERLSIQPENAD